VEASIPYERFREVNERMKAAEQAAQRWQQVQQQYGELADPTTYRTSLDLLQRLRSDPVATAAQIMSDLATREEYRPALASHAARLLQGLRQHQPREDPEPQPDLQADNGAPVFSAGRAREWQEWQQRRMQAQIDERLTAALEPLKALQQERAIAQTHQKAAAMASQMMERARTWHGFTEHEADIEQVFNANPGWTLQDAYLHVLHTKILPKLPAQAQASVVADLQQKAAAQSLNPQQAVPTKSPDFGGDFEKALEWASRTRR
jgi:type II secretory pathway pseudopilin PulG